MQIHTLDLNFLDTPRVIAAYALTGPGGVALIESGPGSTLPALLAGLAAHGIRPADVRDVLLTHIHLDHAGAAGWWARQGAVIHVHPLGAPHLIDPARLLDSARRIYGDQMEQLWGEFLPAPAGKVHVVHDGDLVTAAGLEIRAVETPGHARHHHAYQIGDLAFTGDAAGVRLPGQTWIAIPAPPPEFELDAWQATLARLAALNLARIYPTHFGEVSDPAEHFARFGPLMLESAGLVRDLMAAGGTRETILDRYTAWYEARAEAAGVDGATREYYSRVNNLPMSVDGMMRYWKKAGAFS